jgi:hypothetical protein
MMVSMLQESFMEGADLFAHETQLTRRIAEWQEKLEPLLEVQVNKADKRPT